LSVVTAVLRVVVLCGAEIVKGPIPHRRIDPVVRKGAKQLCSEGTIPAVDVGIPITLVRWIEQFLQARIANRKVRSDPDGESAASMAFANREFVQANRIRATDFNFRDAEAARRF